MMKSIMLVCCFLSLTVCTYAQAIKVEVRKSGDGYQLWRGGQPYYVKGAGGTSYLSRIAEYGGNSIRTWGTQNARAILDSAHQNGLTVMMGLPVAAERHGFDYNDADAVEKQLQRVREEVMALKDHPALLVWGIGNELNLSYKNPKVWDTVNDIARMIHELDPNHPATTVLAGVNKAEIDHIKARTTEIDLLAVNTYGGLETLPAKIRETGWTGAYLVTEWGPTGHWEGMQTSWGAPVEETSSEKAAVYKRRYAYSMETDTLNCLGSYVFLWGQKQERTPTWYGLFTEDGEESEVIDLIHFLWSGAYPANLAPHIYSFQLDGRKSHQSVRLEAGLPYEANVRVLDPEHAKLSYRWELLPEATEVGEGGDFEKRPSGLTLQYDKLDGHRISLTAPAKRGAYRLFVYVSDGQNKVATANIPFFVN